MEPKLKTTTENPGIDIKGRPGSSIKAVMGGVVTTITYIRGYGTTIIIDNGGGFYTVYSHVTNIQTSVDNCSDRRYHRIYGGLRFYKWVQVTF